MPNFMPRLATRTRLVSLVATAICLLAIAIYYVSSPTKATATTTELFFSEYIEGSSNNKALEIYNDTGAPVNLSTGLYSVQMFFNGAATAGLTINLTGTVANGDVYVVAQSSAAAAILAQADQTNGSGWYNGDDAVALVKNGVIIDVIGQIGVDPGTEWGTGLTSTADNTIRRKSTICAGDTNGGNAFDPSIEWDGFANDTFNGLGAHTATCGGNQAINTTCPTPLNTTEGTAASTNVSATDPDGVVVSAAITSAPVAGISLINFVPAAAVGGAATATLNVANTTAIGNYNVVITYTNNDSPTPQTANCTVVVNVTAAPTPTPTPSPTPTPAVPGSVVISQLYGGGGNVGASFKNDFIEIVNHTGAPIDLTGWSVQWTNATDSTWQVTPLTNFVLQPGQYYLIQESAGAGGTVDLPTPDATGTITVGSVNGKAAVVANTTPLVGQCPVGGAIIDFIGYGTANCSEGAPTPALSNTTAALRKNNGCFDTNNNLNDFTIEAPSPRNSASAPTNCNVLSGIGSANPPTVLPGGNTLLTVVVAPPTDPPSSGITVTADLSSIGGSATQAFSGVGNTFTFAATVHPATTPGLKTLPVVIADAQARTASASILLTVEEPHVTISQLYGGGGNGGATFQNDFVELHNPTLQTFDITGWSLQYTSAAGDGWEFTRQPLGGTIAPGEYLLIALASNGAVGAVLPPANINGDINMSATAGKVALVSNFDALEGTCPLSDGDIVDFVGYGTTATCAETANAPAPSNTSAIFRKNGGATDTHHNLNDFQVAVPNPRRTAPIVELGPAVFSSDPRNNGVNTPRDGSITINFTEPVDVVGQWFTINCVSTGLHNDGTFAGANKSYIITPNVNFLAGEQCTVTILKDQIHDQDLDDSGPNTDTLAANYTATFTVANGTAPPYPASVHLTFGNPNGATADINQPNNFLMEKPEFTLAYNRDQGRPNWVSWHLANEWVGTLERVDTFRPDPAVFPTWYRVQTTDFTNTGFDRGHMVPNADRDKETSIPINQATFLMTNILAQSPDNNQGPWAAFENFLRTLTPANEVYIVAGPHGVGGAGSNGPANTIANGKITVPSSTWKVVLVIPKGDNDLSRVTAASRTIAIHIPNIQGIRNNPWENYLTTVDSVEELTGYNFFANLPDAIENSIEAGLNGVNPPGTENQAVTTAEDTSQSVTLTAVSPNPTASFSFTIITPPANGILSGSGANRSYQPGPDFNGSDSFTFRANDGASNSNISTVTITVTEVNDSPTATDDSANTDEDVNLELSASSLTGNDSAGPANENLQVLTVTSVSATVDTHGTVSLSSGTITYSPDPGFNGPASFTYQVCDNGTTNGAPDSLCATGTVNVTVGAVNDAPTLNAIANQTVFVGSTLSFTAVGSDSDLPAQTLTYSLEGSVPAGATINPTTGAFSWTPTAAQGGEIYTLTVRVTDNGTPNLFAEQQFTVGVAYTWTNLLSPIQAGGTYKAGRTIPIKFQLTGASAGVTDADFRLLIFKVNDNVVGDPVDVVSTSSASTGNQFRFENGQYIFNLNTSGLTAGTYQLQVDMGDGVLRALNISLR